MNLFPLQPSLLEAATTATATATTTAAATTANVIAIRPGLAQLDYQQAQRFAMPPTKALRSEGRTEAAAAELKLQVWLEEEAAAEEEEGEEEEE